MPIPDNVEQIVFDSDSSYPEVAFQRDVSYRDSLLLDDIHDLDIGEDGTIYLAGEKWNHREIHKFSASGEYHGSIGSIGEDPGSFLATDRIDVSGNDLWVSDSELNRITQFNASSGAVKQIVALDSIFSHSVFAEKIEYPTVNPLGWTGSSGFLVTLSGERNPAYQPEFNVQFALLNRVQADSSELTRLFKGKAKRFVVGDYAGRPVAFSLEINEQPIIDYRTDGLIYAANSSDFYVRIFSREGQLIRTYRYPYKRFRLDPQEEIFPSYTYNRQLLMVRESADYPEYWPALYHMFLDDEQRLWVSTVTADRDIAEWFIIDDTTQQLIARFHWPVEKPIYQVKKGTAYTIERNSAGFKIVISYDLRIE